MFVSPCEGLLIWRFCEHSFSKRHFPLCNYQRNALSNVLGVKFHSETRAKHSPEFEFFASMRVNPPLGMIE